MGDGQLAIRIKQKLGGVKCKERTNWEYMIKNCSIWGHLKYPVFKIFFNLEHLQN